jgi:hypothetical protein
MLFARGGAPRAPGALLVAAGDQEKTSQPWVIYAVPEGRPVGTGNFVRVFQKVHPLERHSSGGNHCNHEDISVAPSASRAWTV